MDEVFETHQSPTEPPEPTAQATRLTPLERELLSLVERLNSAFEQTSADLRALEERSNRLLNQRLTALEASLTSSISSQTRFNEALVDWLTHPDDFKHSSPALAQALRDLKASAIRR